MTSQLRHHAGDAGRAHAVGPPLQAQPHLPLQRGRGEPTAGEC